MSRVTHIRALTFRGRTLIFLILLSLLSIPGLILWNSTQEQVEAASTQIIEVLNPASRMIEQAKSEVNLQIQELSLINSLTPMTKTGSPNFAQVRLSPTLRKLLDMEAREEFPQELKPLFHPWAQSARNYQSQSFRFQNSEEALRALRDLKEKTEMLHRALDRELSVQLLGLAKTSRQQMILWSSAFLLALIIMATFVYLVWHWTRPLETLRISLNDYRAQPPRSIRGSGVFSAPREVQALFESFRTFLLKFQSQEIELKNRNDEITEKERAAGTLFSALAHLTRHNEELSSELLRKEKLASMGEMAASLAHEIRNPLNSMNLKLELMRDELLPEQQKVLDKVLGEIDRLDALTESHLRTTRAHLSNARELSLENIVRETLDMLKLELDQEHIRVEIIAERDVVIPVRVPENILRAALINFIKNSREALRSTPENERQILLRTRGHEHDWELEILDTGCGFPEAFLHGPIRSFYTTKVDGSGLGLVTAQKMLSAYSVELEILDPIPPYRAALKIHYDETKKIGVETIL